jgi:L-seryl-tRNA(Ser) seleniumtransferase
VDRLLNDQQAKGLVDEYGRELVVDTLRLLTERMRGAVAANGADALPEDPGQAILGQCRDELSASMRPSIRRVLNLTGTVLHTNLGRAPLPESAIEAMIEAARNPVNLEFDLASGARGERDSHLEGWLCRLTGAEAATVVNNNAAAVLIVLNTLAQGREVPVSRGELVEIGGSFRIPEIMARAGCELIEVGTTNRTHLKDFANAINADTALLMVVHTSNYVVQGFTASVDERELAGLAHEHGLALVNDLGSGTLIDLERFGLPHEPTPMEALANGADLVTFSGDKLLGGPQAGIIVGRKDLVDAVKRNPMKRAMRLDKVTIAALEAVLRLYANPGALAELPAIRQLSRTKAEIEALAGSLLKALAEKLHEVAAIRVESCASQIGSGALPVDQLPSAALVLTPVGSGTDKRSGRSAVALAQAMRALPTPVLGRIRDDEIWLDLRTLEDETLLVDALCALPNLDQR